MQLLPNYHHSGGNCSGSIRGKKQFLAMKITLARASFDALIFDCDGALVDSSSLYLTSLQAVLAGYGLEMARDWYLARSGLAPAALVQAYQEQIATIPASKDEFLELVTGFFRKNLHTLQEVTAVADVAREWHRKVPLGVVFNRERVNVRGSLAAVGLEYLFDTVVTIEDVLRGKPAPESYLMAAKQLKTVPERCFVLEDSDEGLRAAQAAGMPSLDIRSFLA
jgi:beta-phosphoglucomutase-like phosphatase (HAD superfamily)